MRATRRPGLTGVRSMFAFFHHLRPAEARAVLARAYESREAICIFEITDPSFSGVLSCLMMPLYVLLFTPFVRPLTLRQIVFTYVVPVLPLLIAWDGFVSTLRAYSPRELREMTRGLGLHYQWDIVVLSSFSRRSLVGRGEVGVYPAVAVRPRTPNLVASTLARARHSDTKTP